MHLTVTLARAGEPVERIALVALVLVLVGLALLMMRRGWLSRARRQSHLAPVMQLSPEMSERALEHGGSGRYLGTTTTGNWLNRVVVHGLGVPSAASILAAPDGVSIRRTAAPSFLIPASALNGARVDSAACGKAYGPGGVVVVTWTLGDQVLDTCLRLDDLGKHSEWVSAIEQTSAASHGVGR